jgi:hypothetical protein
MSYPAPSDVAYVARRETRRLNAVHPEPRAMQANGSAQTSDSTGPLDVLLASARLAAPSPTFVVQVLARIAQRNARQRTVRQVRQVLVAIILIAGMVAGTTLLILSLRDNNPEAVSGLARAAGQLGEVLQSLATAVRVVVRTIPGEPGVVLSVWALAAVLVSATWFRVFANARPDRVQA